MKILVVEDDALTAEALVATLTHQNYTVEVVSDGQAAWELTEAFAYDLILLDVTLPKLDGISLCKRLRSHGYQIPILLLTARDSSHDKAVGLDAGADDYIVKPFDPEELAARIRALLRRNQGKAQAVLEWGSLRLDPSSCEVMYDTQLVSLTAKEYSLLELFLRNTRRVFSCGAILENLWSFAEIPSDEAVRTHIKGLRQKLKGAGAPADLIETVYGIGYRLKSLDNGHALKTQGTGHSGSASKPLAKSTNSKSATPPLPDGETTLETPLDAKSEQIKQQTWTAIAGVWQRFQPRIAEQVQILEQAAMALADQQLDSELQQQAEHEAHTLAGSLGTFGFERGSQLARIIERSFQDSARLDDGEIHDLNQRVMALRQEIQAAAPQAEQASPLPIPEHPVPDHLVPNHPVPEHPLLLVIDGDRTSAEPIVAEAANWGLRAEWATTLATAKKQIQQEPPAVVLLDLAIAPKTASSFNLLAQLQQQMPTVPVLVFTDKQDLQNRLAVARLGGRAFLSKSLSSVQVFKEITRILHHADPVAANLMVVDDDPQLLATVRTLLQPWGLHVTTLADPNRFWETLEAASPDLLILDIKMPDISGIELCQVVRNDVNWSGLPIVILTAYNDANTINHVFAAGADDFVSKPIVGPELVTRIINRLERIRLFKNLAALQQTAAHQKRK